MASVQILVLGVLVAYSKLVSAIECGNALTKSCLGETDKRYDPDSSNALGDQAAIWQRLSGFYSYVQYSYGANNQPATPDESFPFNRFPYVGFFNQTVVGSRFYNHRYDIFESAFEGVPSVSVPTEAWGTSSYEKDGSADFLAVQVEYNHDGILHTDFDVRIYAIDDVSTYSTGKTIYQGVPATFTEAYTCLDEACNEVDVTQGSLRENEDGTVVKDSHSTMRMTRVTREEFIAGIQETYQSLGVPEELQVEVPMTGQCLTGVCPTEEDFCTQDPDCSRSPYQEPDASVKPGVIAGFTILGALVLVGLLYLLHRRVVANRDERIRVKFARRVAETIELRGSTRQVTPGALLKEFDAIDSKNNDGFISKEDLWEFISSGKAGDMDEKDFEALYAVIDVDKNGTVDFMEFCAFMGKCDKEFEMVKNRKSVVAARLSTRKLAANALSSTFMPAPNEDDEEEDRDA